VISRFYNVFDAWQSRVRSLGSKKRAIFTNTFQKYLLLWLKFTFNEIMPNIKKNIVHFCACHSRRPSLGSKKRDIVVNTSIKYILLSLKFTSNSSSPPAVGF